MAFREDRFGHWNNPARNIALQVPVGIPNTQPAQDKIVAKLNTGTEIIDFNERYVYQRGNHYLSARKGEDGSLTGNINKISSGIFTHSVFHPFPDQQAFIISGRFAPEDKLLII